MGVSERDLNQYDISCPHCGCDYFLQTVQKKFAPQGGIKTMTGPLACLECRQVVDLGISIQQIEIERKRRELERLESEINDAGGQAHGDAGADVRSGKLSAAR